MHIHGNTGGSSEAAGVLISKYNVEAYYQELVEALTDERVGMRRDGLRVRGSVRVLESTGDEPLFCRGVTLGVGMHQITHDAMSVLICDGTGSAVEIGKLSLQKLVREHGILGSDFRRHVNETLGTMAKSAANDLLKMHETHLEKFQHEVTRLKSKIAILAALADNAAAIPDAA